MIQSKQNLIDYTLRSLGEPVAQINVTEEQLSDRLDDTLQKFRSYHYDGTQRMYITHQITPEDVTNRYISIPDNVISIVRVFPMVEGSATGTSSGDSGLFSVQYQIRLGDLWNISTGSMAYYTSLMQNLALLDQTFNGVPLFRYTQVVDKLYIDAYWGANIVAGQYVAFECFVTTDPEEYSKIYDQIWVKEYFKALVEKQWGMNLKKFGGISLIGGVTLDGQGMYNEALQEIARLEEQLREEFSEPPIFLVG
jgi:hypothetical protein